MRNKTAAHLIIIIAVTVAAYSNTFDNPFVFDDIPNIASNRLIKDASLLFSPEKAESTTLQYNLLGQNIFWSRWLGYASFALNYKIGGLDVAGYHAVNILIHCTNSLLVYWLALLLFSSPLLKSSRSAPGAHNAALFAALLFAAHPINTQAVTYIVQRFTSMCAMFYLFSAVTYLKFRLSEGPGRGRYAFYGLSIISAICAMKTKEIAFTLPVMIALLEFALFSGALKNRAVRLLPFFLTMPLIPLAIIGASGDMGAASRLKTSMPRLHYLYTEFSVLMTYLRLLILPVGQNLDYDYPKYRSFFNPVAAPSFIALSALFTSGVWMTYKARQGKLDSAWIICGIGILWFFIAISVESSLIPIDDVIFEHRVYLPAAGMLTSASCAWFFIFKDKPKFAVTAAAFIVIALALAAYQRNSVWQSGPALWGDVVEKSPNKARGHIHLGNALRSENDIAAAGLHYEKAFSLDPSDAAANTNMGIVMEERGDAQAAIAYHKKAIELNPMLSEAHYNLGTLYGRSGIYDKAMEHLNAAIKINPGYYMAYNNLGNVYSLMGRNEMAADAYKKALAIMPDLAEADTNLKNLYIDKRDERGNGN